MSLQKLSRFSAFQISVFSTIGSGLLFSTREIMRIVHNPYFLYVTWIGMTLITLVQSACYAELAHLVGGGGDPSYLSNAFHPIFAYIHNFCSCALILPASVSINFSEIFAGLGISSYLLKFVCVFSSFFILFIPSFLCNIIFTGFFFINNVILICCLILIFSFTSSESNNILHSKFANFPSLSNSLHALVTSSFFFAGFNSCNYLPTEQLPSLFIPYTFSVLVIGFYYIVFSSLLISICSFTTLSRDNFLIKIFTDFAIKYQLDFLIPHISKITNIVHIMFYSSPILGSHIVFYGILTALLDRMNLKSKSTRLAITCAAALAYTLIIIGFVLRNFGHKLLSNTSAFISILYATTFVAHLFIQRKYKNKRMLHWICPLIALLSSLLPLLDVFVEQFGKS